MWNFVSIAYCMVLGFPLFVSFLFAKTWLETWIIALRKLRDLQIQFTHFTGNNPKALAQSYTEPRMGFSCLQTQFSFKYTAYSVYLAMMSIQKKSQARFSKSNDPQQYFTG